jgi:threonine dehydrogenase-like Zn-dependent dehydrogenase
MRALWLKDGRLDVREVEAPAAPEGEAVVRVRVAGVCNTDLELVRGYYPMDGIPGHEFVGVVETAPLAPEWVGRRVTGEINAVCGACPACRAGRRTHCEKRSVLGIRGRHGAFAERLALPVANLHAVPEGLSDETAVFAEPLAAALEVTEQVRFEPGQRVVVIGDGKLGQLVARVLASTGVELSVIGRHAAKLDLLPPGVHALNAAEDTFPAGRRADVVVECTGNEQGLELALRLVRPRGTVVLKSTYRGEARLNMSAVVVDEISLVGSRCGPMAPALLRLAAAGVERLVHARYPLADAMAAFEHAARPGVLKVLVAP